MVNREYTLVKNSKLIRKTEGVLSLFDKETFPPKISAMVWDNDTVHLREEYISPVLLNHELIHLSQIQYCKGGFKEYLFNYFIADQDIPYHEKWVEREAYDHMNDMGYIENKFGIKWVKRNEINEQAQLTKSFSRRFEQRQLFKGQGRHISDKADSFPKNTDATKETLG